MLNEFMEKKFNNAINGVNDLKYKEYALKRAQELSDLGISDEVSLRKFHHVSQLVPIFVRRAANTKDKMLYSIVASYVFEKNVNDLEDLQKKVIECLSDWKLIKKAYPQDITIRNPILTFDTGRWIKALNDINMKRRLFGLSKEAVIENETKGWTDMEISKFKHWMKYYEQGNQNLYPKLAQTYTTEGGISVPFMNSNNNVIKMAPIPGLYDKKDSEDEEEANIIQKNLDQKKIDQTEAFKKIRNNIIGRINSAKKLLSSEIGRDFVGLEYEKLLTSLLQLEKDLLVLKNEKLLQDIVARAENSLVSQGFTNAANMLIKIAQDNPFDSGMGDGMGAPPPPDVNSEESGENKKDTKEALVEALNFASAPNAKELPTNDKLKKEILKEKKESEEETKQNPPAAAPPNEAGNEPTEGAPPPPPEPPKTARYNWVNYKTAELQKLELITQNIGEIVKSTKQMYKLAQMPLNMVPQEKSTLANKYFEEDIVDKAFVNIKLEHVIKRLQALSKVFKNREIARQLSIIDLMLDKLGIAGLFPQLAEATKSALESNQYSSTRIEEILSKLMSVMDEKGNANIQIKQDEDKVPSLIDKEMQDALEIQNTIAAPETTLPLDRPVLSPEPSVTPQIPPPVAPPMQPLTQKPGI